jgi:hypothetical protein
MSPEKEDFLADYFHPKLEPPHKDSPGEALESPLPTRERGRVSKWIMRLLPAVFLTLQPTLAPKTLPPSLELEEALAVAPVLPEPPAAEVEAEVEVEVLPEVQIHSRAEWNAHSIHNIEEQTVYTSPLEHVLSHIVVHHAAGVFGSPRAIQDYQRNQGFDDIAYHFIVTQDGQIYEGRPIHMMGAHAGATIEANAYAKSIRERKDLDDKERASLINTARRLDPDYGSIGVVLDGNFETHEIPKVQAKAASDLILMLKETYEVPKKNIIAHESVESHWIGKRNLTRAGKETLCPGEHGKALVDSIVQNPHVQDGEHSFVKTGVPEPALQLGHEIRELITNESPSSLLAIGGNYLQRQWRTTLPSGKLYESGKDMSLLDSTFQLIPLGEVMDLGYGRVFTPKVVNLRHVNSRFGVRNRGEYPKEIQTDMGIVMSLFHPFMSPEELKKSGRIEEFSTVFGVDFITGEILMGAYSEFANRPTALLSHTTLNEVMDIPLDVEGNVLGRTPNNANAKWGYEYIQMQTTDGTVGSLPIMFKGADGPNRVGSAMGGSVVFESPDRKRAILVSGTPNQIANAFHEFKGEDPFLLVYNLDNGTYSLGLQKKDGVLTRSDLQSYDRRNSNGGHGIYML